MGKLNARRALEDYKGSNNDFFKLENDMDTAVVRFLYDNEEELDTYAVHEVEYKGKKRYVECLQTGDCPFCLESSNDKDLKVKVKFFLQLVDERDGKVKTWDRGQKFIPKILGMFNKYGPLVNRPYEVERHGKANDQQTTYELYALDKDDMVMEDFEEKQELLGDMVLVWSAEQMNIWLDGGEPVAEERTEDKAPARGSSRQAASGGNNRQPADRGAARGNTGGARGSSGSARGTQPQGNGAARGGSSSRAGAGAGGGTQPRGGASRGGNASSGRGQQPAGGSPRGGTREPVSDEDVF